MKLRPAFDCCLLASFAACVFGFGLRVAHAQHEHHERAAGSSDVPEGNVDTLSARETARIASGTAWNAGAAPHAGHATPLGSWTLRGHALFFAGYDWQSGDRGDRAATAIGWVMGMAERRFTAASFGARVMLSPELLTVRNGGYPLLLQTGETYRGLPLHDRQHPHDLLMEAALLHTHEIASSVALQIYAALAGEPALGPPGFPHRSSALADPLAPLSHHWQDSTHITFGVLTAGVVTDRFKLEGSWFNGHEPDENRHNVDLQAPNSFSARLSAAPTKTLVAQISYGHITGHGGHHGSLHRATASLGHGRRVGDAGFWSTTAVFGLNKSAHESATSAALLETTFDWNGADVVFGRAEFVQKTGTDLALAAPLGAERFELGSLVVGYLRNFGHFAGLTPGLGVRAAVNVVPQALDPVYGARIPLGGMIYARVAVAPPVGHH